MVSSILRLLKVLNSEAEPGQISLALCFGMIAGFLPFFSIANLMILLIVFLGAPIVGGIAALSYNQRQHCHPRKESLFDVRILLNLPEI